MTKGSSFIDRWVSFSVRRPFLIFAIATTILIASGLTALNLTLKSDFIELLPTDSPSVVNLERLKQRVSSYATLTVAIKSPDLETSQRFAEDLVVKLEELQPDMIQFIDYNIRDLTQFYKDNQWLFADLEDLVDLRDRLKKRIKEETQAALFESLDDTPVEKTDLRIDEFRKKYEEKAKVQDRYPGGYYTTPDRDIIAIFVRPPATKSELNHGDELVAAVQKKVDELVPSNYHPELTVGFTGDVKTQLEERDALATDIGFISIIALLAIFGLLILHYRSLRAIMLTGMPVILGAIIALAFAYLTIGHFNAATAFLSAIIVGNGVNFMIMLMARFLEEIRVGGPDSLE
ncbi:MAG TPA: MMPL family transporter, partial [Myxococcota bacterium]|nr:MMPL family transporter [Myxococcota bacterium]